jgi:hypothetical protein
MRALYHYIIAFLFLGAGIPLTYFGYENGVDAAESGDNNDTGYSLMMAFGLLFLLLSVIIFGFGVHRSLREKREK